MGRAGRLLERWIIFVQEIVEANGFADGRFDFLLRGWSATTQGKMDDGENAGPFGARPKKFREGAQGNADQGGDGILFKQRASILGQKRGERLQQLRERFAICGSNDPGGGWLRGILDGWLFLVATLLRFHAISCVVVRSAARACVLLPKLAHAISVLPRAIQQSRGVDGNG